MNSNFNRTASRFLIFTLMICTIAVWYSNCTESNIYNFPAASLSHETGQVKPGTTVWTVKTGNPSGFMTFGPYTTALPEGSIETLFAMRTDSKSDPNKKVLKIEVFDANANRTLASKDIYWRDFDNKNIGNFVLPFLNSKGTSIEFRVYYFGTGYFEHVSVGATGLTPSFPFTKFPALGFNQNIYGYERDVFAKTPMSSEEQGMRRDFAQMASMGVKYVRMMIHNTSGGFNPIRTVCNNTSQGCQGATINTAAMDNIVNNLTKNGGILDIANEYGIKLIPMFHANAFYWNVWTWSYNWYDSYGRSPAGFNRWAADAVTWVNGIAGRVDSSPKAQRSILYWDLWNEFDHYADYTGATEKTELIRALLKGVNIATERRGLSIINPCGIPEKVKQVADHEGKPLTYVDVHSYPSDQVWEGPCGTPDTRTGDKINMLKSNYPGAKYMLGEYSAALLKKVSGSSYYQTEDEQADLDLATYLGPNSAQTAGVIAALRWDFWDNGSTDKWGVGDRWDKVPRNIYGRYVDLSYNNLIESGGDFERDGSEKYWVKFGSGSSSVTKVRTTRSNTATGLNHLRLNQTSSSDWVCAPKMDVKGKSTIFVSGYVRHSSSSSLNMKVGVLSGGSVGQVKTAAGFSGGSFKSLMAFFPTGIKFSVSGMSLPQICFSTDGTGSTHSLDLDAVSVNGF